ncbi:MAG TPA: bifunctional glutamate N-acetyltransferase/amino-acid acetyltransferase ArgJ [Acidimicrobiia bacterium]
MSITGVPGFEAAGVACGIKGGGAADLALVATATREAVPAAGVFTSNLACAAPVQVTREHLRGGHAAAVVLNSGNANAATGETGRADARRTCDLVAAELGCAPGHVLVCSTGLIGIPLPMTSIDAGIPPLVAGLGTDDVAGRAAADAILTTDTVRKEVLVVAELADGKGFTVGGMAKGAAMLSPAMATMLAVIVTDAAATPRAVHAALEHGVRDTFNGLVVDGCTSTNDTVLLLANGHAGHERMDAEGHAFHALVEGVTEVCDELACAMAADAEGATKLVTVVVRGARSGEDARRAARAVASSQLVQCSLYGCDPYWGRVLSELGASGAWFDPERVDIAYNGITVCRDGVATLHDETALAEAMAGREIEISCDLREGMGQATMRFTDLTHAYVDENMGTS